MKYLLKIVILSIVFPNIMNSDLIEFNNRLCTPNNYKPYTGLIFEYYKDKNALLFEGTLIDGIREGEFIFYHTNGNIKEHGNYLSGKKVNFWITYNVNERLLSKKQYNESGYIFSTYFENGAIKSTGQMVDDLKDGLWIEYFRNKNKRSELFYIAGVIDSSKAMFFDNIILENNSKDSSDNSILESDNFDIESNFFSDKHLSEVGQEKDNSTEKNGKHFIYFDNGDVKIAENYFNNQLDGIWIEYYESGREYINRFYDRGVLYINHKTIIYHETGSKMSEYHETATENNFVKNGRYISYYEHGSKKESGNYSNGYKVGQWLEFYDSGEIYIEYNFSNEVTSNDIGLSYYYKNGNPMIETFILNNLDEIKFNGQYRSFYLSGGLKEKGSYINNIKDDNWFKYYEDGSILSKTSFLEGTGTYSSFYNTGEVFKTGYYVEEKKEGKWTTYYSNENKKQEIFYVKDQVDINEYLTIYNEDGTKFSESYVKSEGSEIIHDGLYLEYNSEGAIIEKGIYQNNLKNGKWVEYFRDGIIKSDITYEEGNGTFTSYYRSGMIFSKGRYENYLKNGKWTKFYENGIKSWEFHYLDDYYNPNKKCFNWYESGYKRSEGYLLDQDDQIIWDGKYLEFYENGIIYLEGQYNDGRMNGLWKQYYDTRSLHSVKKYNNGTPSGDWLFYNEEGDIVRIDKY